MSSLATANTTSISFIHDLQRIYKWQCNQNPPTFVRTWRTCTCLTGSPVLETWRSHLPRSPRTAEARHQMWKTESTLWHRKFYRNTGSRNQCFFKKKIAQWFFSVENESQRKQNEETWKLDRSNFPCEMLFLQTASTLSSYALYHRPEPVNTKPQIQCGSRSVSLAPLGPVHDQLWSLQKLHMLQLCTKWWQYASMHASFYLYVSVRSFNWSNSVFNGLLCAVRQKHKAFVTVEEAWTLVVL